MYTENGRKLKIVQSMLWFRHVHRLRGVIDTYGEYTMYNLVFSYSFSRLESYLTMFQFSVIYYNKINK